jgi:hypothetical protein
MLQGVGLETASGEDGREEFVSDLLAPIQGRQQTMERLRLIILSTSERFQALDHFSSTISSRLAHELRGDLQGQYSLMQLLAKPVSLESINPQDRAAAVLQTLSVFEALRRDSQGLMISTEASLEAGEFDTIIAEEMLSDVFQQPEHHRDKTEDGLVELIRFSTVLMETQAQTVIPKLSSAELLSLWPESQKKAFELYKSRYAQSLKKNYAVRKEHLGENDVIPSDLTEEAVRKVVGDLALKYSAAAPFETSLSPAERSRAKMKALRANPDLARKRKRAAGGRRRDKKEPVKPEGISEDPEKPKAPKPREIVYVSSDGTEMPADSEEYKTFIDTLVQRYPEEPDLADDIQTMLDYLSKVDLSKGGVSGIGPIGRNLTFRQHRFSRLLKLDPGNSTGLPTVNSARAKRTHIIFDFTEKDKKLVVVDMIDKNDIRGYKKRNNIRL